MRRRIGKIRFLRVLRLGGKGKVKDKSKQP